MRNRLLLIVETGPEGPSYGKPARSGRTWVCLHSFASGSGGGMTDTAEVFAERLLQVIDEGRRTATYKLALLTALIDACAYAGRRRRASPADAPHS